MSKVDLVELRKKRIDSFMDTIPKELHFDATAEQAFNWIGQSLINYLPKSKSVIIIPIKESEEEVTKGGIIVPKFEQEAMLNDRTQVSSYYGMIIAAAPDTLWYTTRSGEAVPYKPGDLCTYAKHRETYMRYGMKNMVMVSEFDIWGIIPENAYYQYVFDAKADVFHNLRYRVKSKQEILDRENPEKRK